MKTAEIKNLNQEEIKSLLAEKKVEYVKMKLSDSVSQRNLTELRNLRKTIARLSTAIQKEPKDLSNVEK